MENGCTDCVGMEWGLVKELRPGAGTEIGGGRGGVHYGSLVFSVMVQANFQPEANWGGDGISLFATSIRKEIIIKNCCSELIRDP